MMTACPWRLILTRAAVVLPCLLATHTLLASNNGYDGVYRGDVTRTRGDDSICGKPSYQVSYTVVNGQFSIPYDLEHHVGVNLQIQTDGSFSGSQQYMIGRRPTQVRATGRIAGNTLQAQIEGEGCGRSYRLTKS
jgi:hypothetical protein